MARENEVRLIGVIDNIEKDNVNKICKLRLSVIKRNGRIDYPTILFYEENYDFAKDLEMSQTIIVKGFYATSNLTKIVSCPSCGKKIQMKGMESMIIGFYAFRINKDCRLEEIKEISNSISILGPLCRNIKMKTLPSGIKNAQYQMAIGRKMRVENQDEIRTDFPFISSLGEQAEEDYKRMEEGSQCYINGSVQTRILNKTIQCECGHSIFVETPIMEISPYNVEYLFACKFDEEETVTN